MVTFPGVIRSGSEAKLCVSLLKPEENLQLIISLVNYNQNKTLLQERTEKEFHRCVDFQACYYIYIIHWMIFLGCLIQHIRCLNRVFFKNKKVFVNIEQIWASYMHATAWISWIIIFQFIISKWKNIVYCNSQNNI